MVHVGLTEKNLSNQIKLLFNSERLLKITLSDIRYLDSHTSLNIWDIIAEHWSMIGNSEILNHPISGYIKVMHNEWSYFMSILLSGCLNLASILYVTMRSTNILWHGVKVSAPLTGSNPYLALKSLNLWQSSQVIQSFRAWSTIPNHHQMVVNVWESIPPPGCWRYKWYHFRTHLRRVLEA